MLDESLRLGRQFLLKSQKEDGSFRYHWNFITGRDRGGQSEVRQAGTLWGLALIHHEQPSEATRAAVLRGIDFFRKHTRAGKDGRRWVAYPGSLHGKTGTVALLALAYVDFLRAEKDSSEAEKLSRELDEYLEFLLSLRTDTGHFLSQYHLSSGEGLGLSNPYADGEALLLMVKAAKYLDREKLRPLALESAEAMYGRYVTSARELNPDSPLTKGFYQWGSMAFFEMVDADWSQSEPFARRTIELAHWMIDVHKTLKRRKNTAYAYEGIISAHELARRRGDEESQQKFARVIETGLSKLTSWQVGGPTPNVLLRNLKNTDPAAIGGVMNSATDTWLRIDVTQHQMHAVILARRYVYTAKAEPEQ